MHRPSGIIFDFGDTVLHTVSVDTLAGNRRLLELADGNPGVTLEDIKKAADEVTEWIEPVKDGSMVEVTCQSLSKLIYAPLGLTFRLSAAELEREFWEASLKYAPMTGIYELLDFLQLEGIKTGILSNTMFCAAVQREELAKYNLAHRFSFIVTSSDYGVRKPHKSIFQVAITKMGIRSSDIWFVGDKLDYDIKGAFGSGLYPVWFNWKKEPRTIEGDYLEIMALTDLKEAIEHLYSQ